MPQFTHQESASVSCPSSHPNSSCPSPQNQSPGTVDAPPPEISQDVTAPEPRGRVFIRVVYPQEAADVMEIELSLRVWGFRQEGLEQFRGRFFLSPEKLRFHSLSLSADPMGPNRTEEGGLFYCHWLFRPHWLQNSGRVSGQMWRRQCGAYPADRVPPHGSWQGGPRPQESALAWLELVPGPRSEPSVTAPHEGPGRLSLRMQPDACSGGPPCCSRRALGRGWEKPRWGQCQAGGRGCCLSLGEPRRTRALDGGDCFSCLGWAWVPLERLCYHLCQVWGPLARGEACQGHCLVFVSYCEILGKTAV